jgi:hypothetical protein
VYVATGAAAPPLTATYDGLFRVVERGGKVFKIQRGDSVEVVSVDRLQLYRGATDPDEAVHLRRAGRQGLAVAVSRR